MSLTTQSVSTIKLLDKVPLELIISVCTFLPDSDLATIIQISKVFAHIGVSILYSSITFSYAKDDRRVFLCLQTLASNSDVARCVLSFTLHDIPEYYRWDNFTHLLSRSIDHMTNLRHYSCSMPCGLLPDVCVALSTKTSLRSIMVTASFRLTFIDLALAFTPEKLLLLKSLRPTFPNLISFYLFYHARYPIPAALEQFFKHIVNDHARQLQNLAIVVSQYKYDLAVFLENAGGFPALESLQADYSCLVPAIIGRMPKIRSLELPQFNVWGQVPFHGICCPTLQRYAGPSDFLGSIISIAPAFTSVRLNGAEYRQPVPYILMWRDVIPLLKLLHISMGPIRHLELPVHVFDFDSLPDTIQYLNTLQTLTISISSDAYNVGKLPSLGSRWIAHMPHLHTFLFNDGGFGFGFELFSFARNIQMQRSILEAWSKSSSCIRRVAFTKRFVWRRIRNTWERAEEIGYDSRDEKSYYSRSKDNKDEDEDGEEDRGEDEDEERGETEDIDGGESNGEDTDL